MLKKRMLPLGCCDKLPLKKLSSMGWEMIPAAGLTEARRRISQESFDLCVMQMDRSQDILGQQLLELCTLGQIGGLAIVPPEKIDVLTYQYRSVPIMVLPVQIQGHVLMQVLDYLGKQVAQTRKMQESLTREKRRVQDEKLVAAAKLQLVSHCRRSEEKAHQYILRTAMDNSMSKAAAARIVLRKVEVLLSETAKNQCHASS